MREQRGGNYDAVIVGGGVIGLCCAWRLTQRGARVFLLEIGRPGSGATGVAAGMLAPVGELSMGEPELLRLTLEAAEMYPDFVAELEEAAGMQVGYRHEGALHVALDRDEAAELRRVHDLQRSLGLGAEWLPPRRCRELEPGLAPSLSGGVHAPGEGSVDPEALVEALLEACGRDRFRYRMGGRVTELLRDGERVVGVRTESGDIGAASVIVCAGAWSGQLEWLPDEARPPVRPVKGQVLELRAPDGEPPCAGIVASERVYLVPRDRGRLIVGATVEERGYDTTVTAGGLHELLREAYRLLPDVAEMELVGARAGLRPGTPNNLPLVGPAPLEGLLWATGHFRNGILLAPLAAKAIADQLAGAPA